MLLLLMLLTLLMLVSLRALPAWLGGVLLADLHQPRCALLDDDVDIGTAVEHRPDRVLVCLADL